MAVDPYRPSPIDTSAVELPPAVELLADALARNTHEVWARERMSEGWHRGPARDDERREHPDLIPWEDLPDDERRYDRTIVIETLKALCALGFRLVGPGTRGAP